jgi:hypothetical protein
MKIMGKATLPKVLVTIVAAVVTWVALSGRLVMILTMFAVPIAFMSSLLHRSVTYEIAESYQGWVIVTYGKPGCKRSDRRGFSLVIHVDKSGRGCTSDRDPEGWRRTEFVYVAENGSKTPISSDMISAAATHSPDTANPYEEEHFFVGTSEALKKAWSKEPR